MIPRALSLRVTAALALSLVSAGAQAGGNIQLVGGEWFDGQSFDSATFYMVNGQLTSTRPHRVGRTLDLTGMWVVPPFAEAHHHNVIGVEERDRTAIQQYLADGVFHVKIQGNLPLEEETSGVCR